MEVGGGKKPQQAKEMATDMSKFLYFCAGPAPLDFDHATSSEDISRFTEELKRLGLGPSGIVSKLNVLCYAQSFMLHRYGHLLR